jgi:hypothetical protein
MEHPKKENDMKTPSDVTTIMLTPHEKQHTIAELKDLLRPQGNQAAPCKYKFLPKLLSELEGPEPGKG